jgi:hypothetical protein
MYIELYSLADTDETGEMGEYLGYVSLEEEDVYIDVDDETQAEKLEELFSEAVLYTDPLSGAKKEAEPYTEDFFRNVMPSLAEMDIKGILKEDEMDTYTKRKIRESQDAEEEEGEEEEEELPIDMDITEMKGYDRDEYDVDDQSGDLDFMDERPGEQEEEEYI